MERRFNQRNQTFFNELKDNKCLVGVSGGVDSMVLLALLLAHPLVKKEQLIIAHFNHGLRAASDDEEVALRAFCQRKGLHFRSEKWQRVEVTSNVESAARTARYTFFEKVAEAERTTYLLTAHHQDDLAETVLMKLITGSRLENLVGIRQWSDRGNLRIGRLLLDFSKKELQSYAQDQKLIYWEDESNQDVRFKRNRLRQQVMPLLKEENPQVLEQFSHFVKQLTYATDIIDNYREDWRKRVSKESHGWTMDISDIGTFTEGERYFLLDTFFQETIIPQGVKLNRKQMTTITALFGDGTSNWQVDLGSGWRLQRRYQSLELTVLLPVVSPTAIKLDIGVTKLAVGCFQLEQVTHSREDLEDCQDSLFTISLRDDQLPLTVRTPQSGDQLIFNLQGQHKKVNRLFIDKKIPREKRANYLVLEDNNKQILSLFDGEESYLSIKPETDRIHYRLTYFAKK